MSRARILVVDDSVVARRAITDILQREPSFEVVATAPNGRIALDKLRRSVPDLVVLDLEMPEMDGIEMLRLVRREHPELPVLIFSALTERAGTLTLEALALGASDYVTKPSASAEGGANERGSELLAKCRALVASRRLPVGHASPQSPPPSGTSASPSRIELVVIGASTGGPNALTEIVQPFTSAFPVPILIAQHMPPLFTKLFADRLTAHAAGLRVGEAQGGEALTPGHAWVAPGDFHLNVIATASGPRLAVDQAPRENGCRPSVDVLFRSAARAYGAGILAVVLTGMGQDGLRGAEAIREAGGAVIAQDQASSVVWSMPGAVATAGLADAVLSLDAIGAEILRRTLRAVPREVAC
jgi:two-component system chemotaxis response regulator CheB